LTISEVRSNEIKEFFNHWNEYSLTFNKGEGVTRRDIFKLCQEFRDFYFQIPPDSYKEKVILASFKDRDEIWMAHLITLNQQSKITLEEMASLKFKD
jgi:hypothetical protein